MSVARLFTVLFLLAVLLLLAIQNPQPVLINFLHWRAVSLSLLVIVLSSLIVGVMGGFVIGWRSRKPRAAPKPPEDQPPA